MAKHAFQIRKSVYYPLLLSTITVVMVFYAVGIYLNTLGINYVNQDLQRSVDAEASYIVQSLEQEISALLTTAQELAGEQTLLRFVISYDILTDYQRTESIRQISNDLLRVKRFSPFISEALVYLPGIGRTISSTDPIYNTLDEDAFAALETDLNMTLLKIGLHYYSGYAYLTLQKSFSGNVAFLIALRIAPDDALNGIRLMRSAEDAQFALTDTDGRLFVSTETASALMDAVQDRNEFLYQGNEQFIASQRSIPSLHMELHYFKRVSPMLEPLTRHRTWMWILTGLAALLLTMYLAYFRTAVYRPMNAVYQAMGSVEKVTDFSIPQRYNEFKVIEEQFRRMYERIEKLVSDVYEERFRAQKAELLQLQMQINPHFFYNTLFLIYRMAQKEGADEIAKLSFHLSNFYRYITRSNEAEVLLRDEVEHIDNYLEIQRARFSPRITIAADPLPPSIALEKIPAIILQPLIENAFEHGVRDVAAGGYVKIHYQVTDTWFRVTVADNGGNMNKLQVAQLREKIRKNELHEGSALVNLNRRLALRYGERYGLTLESVHHGLCVSITLPRKEVNGNDVPADR
ncbi:MAG: histidine kinase [Bacillota bacterium]